MNVELSCVGKGTAGCVGAEYVSIGVVVPGSLGKVVASRDAEGVEVVGAGASGALNSKA